MRSPHPYPPLDEIMSTLEERAGSVRGFNAEEVALRAGHILSLNMVMLGAAAATRGFPLESESLINSMRDNLPPRLIDVNLRAFWDGFEAAAES